MDSDMSMIKSSAPADLPTAPGLKFLYTDGKKWIESNITITAAWSWDGAVEFFEPDNSALAMKALESTSLVSSD